MKLLSLAKWLIVLFVIGLVLQYKWEFLPPINRILGIGLVVISTYYLFKNHENIPVEVILFGIFIIWSAFTGVLMVRDSSTFIKAVRLLVQLWALFFGVTIIAKVKEDAGVAFVPFILCAIVLVGLGLIAGDLSFDDPFSIYDRSTSFLNNANELGYYALMGIVSMFYFFTPKGNEPMGSSNKNGRIEFRGRRLMPKCFVQQSKDTSNTSAAVRLLLLMIMIPLGTAIVFSGSRKSFLGLIVFLVAWIWFCYRKTVFRKLSSFILTVSMLMSLYLSVNYVFKSTYLGDRLQIAIENQGDRTRNGLYVDGIELIQEYPIAGVGLRNFMFYTRYETDAHSDFIEVLATTGIVGFVLYFSIYLVLWLRLGRVEQLSLTTFDTYQVGFFKAVILMLLFLAAGRDNFLYAQTWVILSGIVGYSCVLEQKRSLVEI